MKFTSMMRRAAGCGTSSKKPECAIPALLWNRSRRPPDALANDWIRSEEHTSELQSPCNIVCRLLLEKIKVTVQPAPTSDYDTKMTTVLAGGDPPNIMRINDNYVRQFSVANQLMDLTPFIKASGIHPN